MRCRRHIRRRSQKVRRNKIESPAYLSWIRTLPCLVQDRNWFCWGPIDPHHVGHNGHGRDNDYNAVPLCRRHHDLAHDLGRQPFEERFNLSFAAAIQGLNDEWPGVLGRRIA